MAEALLGRQVRCFGCGRHFVAEADPAPPNPPAATQNAAPTVAAAPIRPVKTVTPATPTTAAARPAKTAPAQVVKGRRCQPKADGTCVQ